MKLLVVDDRPEILQAFTDFLAGEHEIITADCVEAAVCFLDRETVDAVITDHHFGEGELTGSDFLQILQETPTVWQRMANLCLVLMSGSDLSHIVPKGVKFLKKPFNLKILDHLC